MSRIENYYRGGARSFATMLLMLGLVWTMVSQSDVHTIILVGVCWQRGERN